MNDRFVAITPSPIADMNLTAEEAGLILTGLAVHEISHPRYGRDTYNAVMRCFSGNGTAQRLSNLLDDIRIERRFVEDYPGYMGIFKPTLDYIGGRGTNDGKNLHEQKLTEPVNLAIGATRYYEWSDWSDPVLAAEAKWWQDWADRWAPEDDPNRHVEGIREALAHIVTNQFDPPGSAPSPIGGAGDNMNDSQLNTHTRYHREDNPESSCSGSEAVDEAAKEGDTTAGKIQRLKDEAQEIIDEARNIEDNGWGEKVDVSKSLRGINFGRNVSSGSESATRVIRNAIIQSRTGHMAVEPYRRTGRLDQKGLSRIAYGDYRTFEKRTAASVGKFLVWVMVDCSMSMDGGPLMEATRVAHSLAAATTALPSVRMAIWGWSNSFRGIMSSAGVAKAWETGWPLNEVFKLSSVHTGGTPDAIIMSWAGRAIKKEMRADETPLIIFISDGEGMGEMNERVQEVRDMGVQVISVSFGNELSAAAQEKRFGRGNFIPWAGSIEKTARPLARLLIKIVTKGGGK